MVNLAVHGKVSCYRRGGGGEKRGVEGMRKRGGSNDGRRSRPVVKSSSREMVKDRMSEWMGRDNPTVQYGNAS